MMESAAVLKAARLIGEARRDNRSVDRLSDDCRPPDDAAGYAVQEALHGWLAENGLGRRAGWKLGCTTPVMQALVGVDSAVYGGIGENTVYRGDTTFEKNAFLAPGVECEIAVRFGDDVPGEARHDRESIAGSIDAAMVAMEVVDNRYGDWTKLGTPTLIADDFFNAACVLGPPVNDWRDRDLAAATGRTAVNDIEAGVGVGADVMGHPLDAVVWLAAALAARGRTLQRGDIVLTGSIVATQWIETYPCRVEVAVDGLGALTARFD